MAARDSRAFCACRVIPPRPLYPLRRDTLWLETSRDSDRDGRASRSGLSSRESETHSSSTDPPEDYSSASSSIFHEARSKVSKVVSRRSMWDCMDRPNRWSLKDVLQLSWPRLTRLALTIPTYHLRIFPHHQKNCRIPRRNMKQN